MSGSTLRTVPRSTPSVQIQEMGRTEGSRRGSRFVKGVEGSRRSNGSAVVRDALRWGSGRLATLDQPSVLCSFHSAVSEGRRRPARSYTNEVKEVRHGAPRIRREGPARPNWAHRATSRGHVSNSSIAVFRPEASCFLPAKEEARRQSQERLARRAPLRALQLKGMWRLFHPKLRYGRASTLLWG